MFSILHLAVTLFFGSLILCFFLAWILSFLPMAQGNAFVRFVNMVIRPVYEPLDRRIPRIGVISVSFLVAFWGLYFVMQLILAALPPNW